LPAVRAVVVTFLAYAGGCSLYPDAFKDEYAHAPMPETASSRRVESMDPQPESRVRSFEPSQVTILSDGVTHWPLYFEDNFEDVPPGDDHFAWTGADYLHIITWRARYLVNLFGFPVSAVCTPPWQMMVSDDRMGEREFGLPFDAAKYDGPAPVYGPLPDPVEEVAPTPESAEPVSGASAPSG